MSAYLEISQAISTRLSTLTGGWPIAWDRIRYNPTVGTNYLILDLFDGPTEQADLGTNGTNVVESFFQITIAMYGSTGWLDEKEKLDQICEHFKRGTKLTKDGITVTIGRHDAGKTLNIEGTANLPITFFYTAYTPN